MNARGGGISMQCNGGAMEDPTDGMGYCSGGFGGVVLHSKGGLLKVRTKSTLATNRSYNRFIRELQGT